MKNHLLSSNIILCKCFSVILIIYSNAKSEKLFDINQNNINIMVCSFILNIPTCRIVYIILLNKFKLTTEFDCMKFFSFIGFGLLE